MPLNLRKIYNSTLGFLPTPLTTLLVLIYFLISLSVLITDQLPPVPPQHVLLSRYGGLNVTEAWQDLQHITAHPHPHNSHANDVVREYLLRRVEGIKEEVANESDVEIKIEDDLFSTGLWANPLTNIATYFEGRNILVKVRGTGTGTSNALLFSAHYDSVSTSSGATDDGMGVVTLLQLIRYFVLHPPRRTVVFNINSGEEDGLNGAHVFLEHPWVKGSSSGAITEPITTFINLEGASEGGRPIMFRATGLNTISGWKRGLQKSSSSSLSYSHPHANVISGEAFERGVVRSATDYEIYTSQFAAAGDGGTYAPMDGLDLSFYRGRAYYHTKYDRVAYTKGGERALWAMMEGAWTMGVGLDEDTESDADGGKGAVYFDLFNTILFLIPLTNLLTFDICALVVGPIVLILLAVCEGALMKSRRASRVSAGMRRQVSIVVSTDVEGEGAGTGIGSEADGTNQLERLGQHTLVGVEDASGLNKGISQILWHHAKFWVALVFLLGAQAGLVIGFVRFNPFVVYTYQWIPLLTSLSLSLLVLYLVLSPPLPSSFCPPTYTPWTDFRTTLTQTYVLTWLLVLLSTIGITRVGMGGGTYVVSAWNGVVWVGCVVCAAAGCLGVNGKGEEVVEVQGAEQEQDHQGDDEDEDGEDEEDRENRADERTPLLLPQAKPIKITGPNKTSTSSRKEFSDTQNPYPHILPSILALVLLPTPLIITSHIALILLSGTSQTLTDGSPAALPYAATALLSILCVLPLAPFVAARKIKGRVVWACVVVGLLGVGVTWVPWMKSGIGARFDGGENGSGWEGGLFPFSETAPLKVFFQQKVEVVPSSSASVLAHTSMSRSNASLIMRSEDGGSDEVRVTTTLTGASPFLQEMVLPRIPSYVDALEEGREVKCEQMGKGELKVGLVRCEWGVRDMGGVPGNGNGKSLGVTGTAQREEWDWISSESTSRWFTARAVDVWFNRSSSTNSEVASSRSRSHSASQSSFEAKGKANDIEHDNDLVKGARFEVEGVNTRSCRVYFDQAVRRVRVRTVPGIGAGTSSAVTSSEYSTESRDALKTKTTKKKIVVPDDGIGWDMQRGYTSESVEVLRLWSREWGRRFVVDVEWASEAGYRSRKDSGEEKRTGRVACEWVEYESGMVGMEVEVTGRSKDEDERMGLGSKIPAYEEILTFLPKWAVASKLTDGLLEVEERFRF